MQRSSNAGPVDIVSVKHVEHPFFGLTNPWEDVVRTLALIPEKGSIRGVARATHHDKITIFKWVDLARKHFEEVSDYFYQDLHLDRVQVDEIWSYIKKAKEYHRRRF